MMYAKLALRNVRRTARDYLIYVVTLVFVGWNVFMDSFLW